jgi:hypothetical protein
MGVAARSRLPPPVSAVQRVTYVNERSRAQVNNVRKQRVEETAKGDRESRGSRLRLDSVVLNQRSELRKRSNR